MASTTAHEVGRGTREPHGQRHCGVVSELHPSDLDLGDLPDVSALLARLLDERIPLALIADLAHPGGPDSDGIMASEALDVG